MTIVYRRANRMKDMSAAFAAASAAHPRDEGLLRGVFVSYVRQATTLYVALQVSRNRTYSNETDE